MLRALQEKWDQLGQMVAQDQQVLQAQVEVVQQDQQGIMAQQVRQVLKARQVKQDL